MTYFFFMPKKHTLENFIKEAVEIHGDKYDYSKTDYTNAKAKVRIICPIHGEFWQTPDKHINCRQGCPYCGGKKKPTTEEYLQKVNKVHNGKYDYSETVYQNKNSKICIICHQKDENGIEHGKFYQIAHNHLNGNGCPKCAGKYRYTTDEIIEKFRIVHNNIYDYSKVKYHNTKTKVCIICPEHGEFWQAPYHHLNGNGCPHCKESLFEKRVAQFFKENGIQYMEHANCILFPWLHKQHLDFYLPKYNIAIECQGEQHYFPVDFAGKGEEWAINKFKQIQKLDEEKLKLCNENGVKLLYIKFDDDIEVIIKNILKI